MKLRFERLGSLLLHPVQSNRLRIFSTSFRFHPTNYRLPPPTESIFLFNSVRTFFTI